MNKKVLIWGWVMVLLMVPVWGALSDGLEQYYTFDSNVSTNLHTNSSFGDEGTVTGATPSNISIIGQSYFYDGSGDKIVLNTSTAVTSLNLSDNVAHSMNFWVNVTANNGLAEIVSGYGSGKFRLTYNWVGLTDFGFQWEDGSINMQNTGAGPTIILNNWYMFTYTFDGVDIWKLYVNGVSVANETVNSGSFTGIGDITLGQDPTPDPLTGHIDEFGIWRRELTQEEIIELYNSGSGLQYPFTGTSSTTDINFIITDQWNGSSINTFNVNVSWSNGTTTQHTTTNGTISLINVSSGAINVTYYNMTDYFNQTTSATISENVSNSVSTTTYQAVLCLNATEKITNSYVVADLFTAGSKTTTECFNITAGSHNVMATKTGWNPKNQTFTVTALTNTTHAVENMSYANLTIYVRDANSSAFLTGYDINLTSINHTGWIGEQPSNTTNHTFYLINGTYHVSVDKAGYSLTGATANITINTSITEYTFYLYPTNTLNITFYDEETNTILSGPTITADIIIGDANATTDTTTTGTMWIENLTAGSYEIRYSASGYQERSYYFTLTNRTYNFLSLFMLNDTGTEDITHNLYDEYGNSLEGYIIKLLRYYPAENGYLTVDMGSTNAEGQTVLRAERNGPYYKWRITQPDGTVIKTTGSTQIYDTTVTLYVTLGTEIGDLLDNLNGVSSSLKFLNTTNQFKYVWDNSDNTVVQAKLLIYELNPLGNILHNSSTVASSSGTMYVGITEKNDTTYRAYAYVTFSGQSEDTLLQQLDKTFSEALNIFGKEGVFLSIIIFIVFAAIGLWSPPVSVILAPTAVLLTRIAHLHSLEYTYCVGFIVIGVIIAWVIRDKA